MGAIKFLLRVTLLLLPLSIAACTAHRYTPDLLPEQTELLAQVEETVRRGMERSQVFAALRNGGIAYSNDIPVIFAGGILDKKYRHADAIYIDVAPAMRAGCWDEPLVIIKFAANGRVSHVITEHVNFCT